MQGLNTEALMHLRINITIDRLFGWVLRLAEGYKMPETESTGDIQRGERRGVGTIKMV